RDTLAHGVVAKRTDVPLAITDAQYDEAAARAERSIATLAAAGHPVHGDLEDLRATRPEGRFPGDVTDAEVLEAALQTIVDLLILMRERAATSDEDEPGSTSRVRRLARRATAPYVRRTDDSLRQRIAALEAQVAADRVLHQRVAVLHDAVTELLLPADIRDEGVTEAALRAYRRNSL
ncbi:DUF6752 domain-containing protein, partial [Nocardioides sp.]